MCLTSDTEVPAYFGCTADRRAKGACNLVQYSAPLPTQFRYFTDPTIGGRSAVSDYCPLYTSYRECSDTAAPSGERNFRGETFGEGSYCFESSLSQHIDNYYTNYWDYQGE